MKNVNKISASWFDEKLQNADGITEMDKDIYFLEKNDFITHIYFDADLEHFSLSHKFIAVF